MTTLIVLGNLNQFTFANSIISANAKSRELFEQPLKNIFVLHSKDSQLELSKNHDWIEHIEKNGVKKEVLIEKTIESTEQEESIQKIIDHIEIILKGIPDSSKIIVDLTNGTSEQKNLLSIISYILDIKYQYLIDISKLSKLTKSRDFISLNILQYCYTSVPDSTQLDSLAYLNLSEIVRYKKIIKSHTKKYVSIESDYSDREFFKDNLDRSIQLKLQGDKSKDNAIYRIAASSISASIEDLISILIKKLIPVNSPSEVDRKTLGAKLKIIEDRIDENHSSDFDIDFFNKFNNFILYLRNSSTHKSRILTDFEKFKAELSVKMAFPFIEFYTDIVYPLLSDGESYKKPKQIKKLSNADISPAETLYYGLDGDNTGKILEDLFLAGSKEDKFTETSRKITKGINEISKLIKEKSGKNAIIFNAGDDLLFKGNFTEETLEEFKNKYTKVTGDLTCSIGYGRSFQEVYLALKLAKNQPGKNSIFGIELC